MEYITFSMAERISKKTNIKRSQVYEDYEDEYIYLDKYLNLNRKDFCCKEMYENLLGENNGECELHFGYSPHFREYYINVKVEFGGAVCLIFHCLWCGAKLPKSLRDEWFGILEREYNIETDIFEWRERTDFPQELKSDEWWKKRKL